MIRNINVRLTNIILIICFYLLNVFIFDAESKLSECFRSWLIINIDINMQYVTKSSQDY
jgi:hypothetical protein